MKNIRINRRPGRDDSLVLPGNAAALSACISSITCLATSKLKIDLSGVCLIRLPPMFNLDGRRMHVTHTAADGEVNAGTIFAFDQQDDIVSAQYSGGPILKGYLVGRLEGSKLEFRYAQINVSGKLDGGHSRCDLELTPTGQIRLIEHFEWESRAGGGSNIFEELASP